MRGASMRPGKCWKVSEVSNGRSSPSGQGGRTDLMATVCALYTKRYICRFPLALIAVAPIRGQSLSEPLGHTARTPLHRCEALTMR